MPSDEVASGPDPSAPDHDAEEGIVATRRLVAAVNDERGLELLATLVERGPVSARDLLEMGEWCESDLHGMVGEFRLAGLVEPVEVDGDDNGDGDGDGDADDDVDGDGGIYGLGQPGYRATETTELAIERIERAGVDDTIDDDSIESPSDSDDDAIVNTSDSDDG